MVISMDIVAGIKVSHKRLGKVVVPEDPEKGVIDRSFFKA